MRIWEPAPPPDLLARMISLFSSDEVRGGEGGGERESAGGEVGGRRGSQDLAPEVAAAREECSARVSAREWRACCRGWGSHEREGLGGVRERGGVCCRRMGWIDGRMDGLMFARSSIQATSDSTNQN